MPRWQLDLHYAHVDDFSGHRDRGRQIYSHVAGDLSVPDSVRAQAQFSLAYSFMQEGRYDDARAQFRALIAQWGEDPPAALRNTVNGAKTQLEKIAEWEKRRAAEKQSGR